MRFEVQIQILYARYLKGVLLWLAVHLGTKQFNLNTKYMFSNNTFCTLNIKLILNKKPIYR